MLTTNSPISPDVSPVKHSAPLAQLPALVMLCLGATWVIWGSTYLAIKYALLSFAPFLQMGTRFIAAGALLMTWTRLRGAPWPQRMQWRNALVVGTLMIGGGMGGTAFAEQSIGSGLIVAFIAIVPLLITGLNLLWGVVPRRREILAIGTGLVGVLLLTQGAGFKSSAAGLLAIALASSCWSLGSVLSQRSLPLARGAMGFASEMLCGGVVLMAASALHGEKLVWPAQPAAIAAWLYLVVFGSLIGFNAYMYLLAKAPAALASSYTLVNPVIAMLLGVAFAGEIVTGFEWIAVSVVLLGVMLLLWPQRSPQGSDSVRAHTETGETMHARTSIQDSMSPRAHT
jgi:drug/metabolite transporter (DMT)-like permease